MKRISCVVLLGLLMISLASAQTVGTYPTMIRQAWKLYQSKNYHQSAQKYSEAFAASAGKGYVDDRYNAACSWALANEPDSAFVQLFRIAENGKYTNLSHISSDSDLITLHRDERWSRLIELIKSNKDKAEVNLDKPLVAILDTIYMEDQMYRQQINGIEEKYGWESDEMKALWNIILVKDSVNLLKVKKILDERGWLGANTIGNQGNSALFLVIQHADLETQEKYLPMMREAVRDGNADPGSLALLEDRVALRKGGKQMYGSQVARDQVTGEYYVLPLIDPDNVDKRRAEVGLDPIQDYVSNWGITWNVEDYKKKLPGYEAKQGQ